MNLLYRILLIALNKKRVKVKRYNKSLYLFIKDLNDVPCSSAVARVARLPDKKKTTEGLNLRHLFKDVPASLLT